MANGQFVIPGTAENEALRHQVDEVFESISSQFPEAQQVPEVQRGENEWILDVQVELEEMRAFATEATLRKANLKEIKESIDEL